MYPDTQTGTVVCMMDVMLLCQILVVLCVNSMFEPQKGLERIRICRILQLKVHFFTAH